MNAPALVRTPALTAEWKKIPAGMRSLWRQCLPGGDGGDVARSMTINFLGVALAENADVLNEALQRLQRRSPCRAFLVLIDDAAKPGAAELAATTRGTGSVRDIVLEEILVRVPRSAFAALPGLIRPLLMNDLPNHLFWAAPWPADAGHFDALADLCDHVVIDSRRLADPTRDLAALAALHAPGSVPHRVTDLAWLRLRPWRRALAEAFQRVPWVAGTKAQATIRHGQGGKASALLLADWLRARLGASVQCDPNGNAVGSPDDVVVRTGGFEVELQLARQQIRVHVTTPEHCYLPFTVPSSRGSDGDLLAAAIDMV